MNEEIIGIEVSGEVYPIKNDIDDTTTSNTKTWSSEKIKDSLEDIKKEAGNVYSKEETICGKWIDGKTIYRRVLQEVITSSGDFTYTESIGNFGRLIRCDLLIIGNNNNNQEVNTYYSTRAQILNNVATFTVKMTTTYELSGIQYLIVEYTKTTD